MEKTEKKSFSSREEAQNYFSKLDINTPEIEKVVEAKIVASAIFKDLEEDGAPAMVTNFWYLLGKMADERLKRENLRVLEMGVDDRIKIIHVFPEELVQKYLKEASAELFGRFSDIELSNVLNTAMDNKDAPPEILEMIGIELNRRNRVS